MFQNGFGGFFCLSLTSDDRNRSIDDFHIIVITRSFLKVLFQNQIIRPLLGSIT